MFSPGRNEFPSAPTPMPRADPLFAAESGLYKPTPPTGPPKIAFAPPKPPNPLIFDFNQVEFVNTPNEEEDLATFLEELSSDEEEEQLESEYEDDTDSGTPIEEIDEEEEDVNLVLDDSSYASTLPQITTALTTIAATKLDLDASSAEITEDKAKKLRSMRTRRR